MDTKNNFTRRQFVSTTSKAVAGMVALQNIPIYSSLRQPKKINRLAMVGTGHRGADMLSLIHISEPTRPY